jgi:hypothetical protein
MEQDYAEYLTTLEAVEYLRRRYKIGSKSQLDHRAMDGSGPEFVKAGLPRLYHPQALNAWARSRIRPGRPRPPGRSAPIRRLCTRKNPAAAVAR